MSFCQIYYMDIVTNPCPIRGIIVIAKYSKLFQLAYSNLRNIRHQIIGNTVRIFSHGTALMCTDRVEITKQDHIPFRICLLDICQDLLQHGLGPAIGVGALSLGAFLCDRNHCRITIYRCRGGKDNVLHTMLSHHIYQCKSTGNIIFIILPRLLYGFSNCLKSRKMNTAVYLLFIKNLIHSLSVKDICFIKRNLLSCDGFHSLKALLTGICQIVHYYHIISCILKLYYCMAANISGTTCN